MSGLDLWSIGSGGKVSSPAADAPAQPAYDPTDLAVRLAMLEDATPEGRAAVAGVMANRAKAAKGDLLGALTAPNAFEPWASKQKELAAIDPNSDAYKATAAAIIPILQGKTENPVGSAINFYSPESQAALAGDGRQQKPSFDDGKGVRIGGNLFFGTGQTASAGDAPAAAPGATPGLNLVALGGGDPKSWSGATGADGADLTANAAPTIKVQNGKVVFGDSGQEVPAEQVKLLHSLVESGRLKSDGTIDGHIVHMQRDPSDTFSPGDFYISAPVAGKTPAETQGPKLLGGPQSDSFGGGLAQGAQDVGLTLVNGASHLPGAEDNGLQNFLHSQQQVYDATHDHGFSGSGLGRFTGQVAASAPIMGAAEVPAVAGLTKLGPVGEFIAGKGVGGLATRAGSLAARGAVEGAGGSALISSASDEPLGDQIAGGALGGALLGPTLHGLIAGGVKGAQGLKRFLEPFTDRGAGKSADRTIRSIAAEGGGLVAPDLDLHVPGAPGPTLAEATANPALAQLQRNLAENYHVSGQWTAHDEANNAARQAVTLDAQGDPATVADLARQRAALVDAHRAAVFGGAGEADAAPVVSTIDAALASPEAAHPDVAPALNKARNALVTEPDKALTPAEAVTFHRQAGATFGADGDAWTPDVMDAAKRKLGAKFEDIAGRTNISADAAEQLGHNLRSVVHDASQVIEEGKIKPLQNLVEQIGSTVQDGQISGASYKALIRRNGPLDILARSGDGAMRHYAGQIREHLDDALEQSMASDFPGDRIPQPLKPYDPSAAADTAELAGKAPPAPAAAPVLDDTDKALNLLRARKEGGGGKGPRLVDMLIKAGGVQDGGAGDLANLSPEDEAANAARGKAALDELRATRLGYKNLKTAEMALRTAGPDGQVTPRALFNAVRQNFGSFAYKGGGPLGDVAADAMRAIEGKAPTFEKDPAQLFAHRENLNTAIGKLSKAGETDDAARAAAAKLTEVRDAMDAALDKSTPGYARYRHIADSTAEPIEAQRYLQSLPLSTNGPRGGTVTLNLVNKALERIDKARSLPGPHPAKAITDATLLQLRSLQADLERQANRDLGKAKGSPTYQLATSAVDQAGAGVPSALAQDVAGRVPLIGRHVAGAVQQASDNANARVLRAISSRMLNPESMPTLPPSQPGSRVAGVMRQVGATLPGVAGGVLGSRLFGR